MVNNMQQLLIETQAFKCSPVQLLEGIKSSAGNPIVEGILSTVELKNGNGRYYPRQLWEEEMQKYDEFVKENRALGELDHSDSQVVNLKNVSHIIREYWWDGDHIMGKIEILPTPAGNIVKSLIENNVVIGISSRGVGELEQKGGVMEVSSYSLIGWDFVSNPSNPGSFMHMVNESKNINMKDYTQVNNIIREILCSKGSCPIF